MKEPEGLDIRYSDEKDWPYLVQWLSVVEDQRWFPVSLPQEVEWFARNWMANCRFRSALTATINQVPCGLGTLFLMPYKKVSHHAMLYLIVDKNFRKRGVGSSLLRNVMHLAKGYFSLESLCVEVFEGCPLLSLLQREGFELLLEQAHFVKEGEGRYLSRILLERFFKEEKQPSFIRNL